MTSPPTIKSLRDAVVALDHAAEELQEQGLEDLADQAWMLEDEARELRKDAEEVVTD